MTAVETTTTRLDETQLGRLFQYTVEAYKTFEKLAENLPSSDIPQNSCIVG